MRGTGALRSKEKKIDTGKQIRYTELYELVRKSCSDQGEDTYEMSVL